VKIEDIVKTIAGFGGAVIGQPASTANMERCIKRLADELCLFLPDDYFVFLGKYNGFAWNGVEFYGTDPEVDQEIHYVVVDVVFATLSLHKYNKVYLERTLIGRSDEEVYVYNMQSFRYEALDIAGHEVIEEWRTFEELFLDVVVPRM